MCEGKVDLLSLEATQMLFPGLQIIACAPRLTGPL